MHLTLFNFTGRPDEEGCALTIDGLMVESEVEMKLYHVHLKEDGELDVNNCNKVPIGKMGCVLTQDMTTELMVAHHYEDLKPPLDNQFTNPVGMAYLEAVLTPVEYDVHAEGASHGGGDFIKTLRRHLKTTLSITLDVMDCPEREDEIGYGFQGTPPASIDDMRDCVRQMISLLGPDCYAVRATHAIKTELFRPVQFILEAVGK